MGLKYNVMLVKGAAEQLLESLVESGATDETHLCKRSRELRQLMGERHDELMERVRAGEEFEDGIEYVLSVVDDETEEQKLYEKRHEADTPSPFEMWWRQFDDEWIILAFTFNPFRRCVETKLAAALCLFLAGIKELYFVDYHHGSDEGNLVRAEVITHDNHINLSGEGLDLQRFEARPDESERYELYAERLYNETGVPLPSVHEYLDEHGWEPIPWDHSVSFEQDHIDRRLEDGQVYIDPR